jgi:hypothetical protein
MAGADTHVSRRFGVHNRAEAMTMLGNRSRATKPTLAVWLLVLVADAAAASGTALLVYVLSGVIAVAIVLAAAAAVRATTGQDRLTPRPIRVRAHRAYDYRRR